MIEEYGGVAQFSRLIVQSGVNAFAAAEQALPEEIPWTRSWDKTTVTMEPVERRRFDNRVERERAVHVPQAGIGRRRGVVRS